MKNEDIYEMREGLYDDIFSYFVKYDSVHGVTVSPDSNVPISKKEDSCYEKDYRWEAVRNLGFIFKRR